MKHLNKKAYTLRIIGWMLVLFLASSSCSVFADFQAIEHLKIKMAAINQMKTSIQDKQFQVEEINRHLNSMAIQMATEIESVQKQQQITSFVTAIKMGRIKNNLQLIAELHALKALFDKRIAYFSDGLQKLEFLASQAQDDIKVLETGGHMVEQPLLNKIDESLQEYESATSGFLINVQKAIPLDLETTWKNTLQGLIKNSTSK